MTRNIFVVGLDDFNLRGLRALRGAEHYEFHGLLSLDEVKGEGNYPVKEALHRAERRLADFPGSIDAIIGYWDFPVTVLLPILCDKYGLLSPSLQSVIKCEHKYWCRMEQSRADPDCVPHYVKVDPYDDNAANKIDLPFPFWIKPAKGTDSMLAFKVTNEQDLAAALNTIRQGISAIANPFDLFLSLVDLPQEIAAIGGRCCIVEEMIPGELHTVEGYVFQGEIHVHGVLDSPRYEGTSSFLCYQYPSRLPRRVQEQMIDNTKRVMSSIGLDNSAFNIEYFYEPEQERLTLLEINPRISQSHAEVFKKVDGDSNHQIVVDLALGNRPNFQYRKGEFPVAAKFYLRRFEDGIVKKVPSDAEIEKIKEEIPDALIDIHAKEGRRLSQLIEQDSYSYKLASIYLGAEDYPALSNKYQRCREELQFEFAA
jgi:biotin carboxylase